MAVDEPEPEPEAPDEAAAWPEASEADGTGAAVADAEPVDPGGVTETAEADEADVWADEADELDEPPEVTDLKLTEPVEQAEPVEDAAPRRGRGVLLGAGFVLAAAVIVGGAFAIVGSLTHGFKKPVEITYKKSAVFSLKTGECVDPRGQSASVVSCGTPHDAEVFATFAIANGTWPGNARVEAAASSGCSSRLSGYLNPQLAISLASTYVYPDHVAWQAGTRTVICEVRATSGQLTGSVRSASASG